MARVILPSQGDRAEGLSYHRRMDDPTETPDAFVDYVRHLIDTRSSQADVGKALSPKKDRSWLTRILRKQRRFSLSRLFMILRELGMSETDFFRGYIETIGPFDASVRTARPQDLLRRARAEQGVSVECLDRVQGKSITPLSQNAPLYSVPDRSREIDALRESDREAALYRAEIWVLEILATIKPGHSLKGAKVAELASALGVWASVERLARACPGVGAGARDRARHARRLPLVARLR